VRKEDLNTVRRELKNYEVMKTLVDRWIEMATELSNLRDGQQAHLIPAENLALSSV